MALSLQLSAGIILVLAKYDCSLLKNYTWGRWG